MKYWKEENNIDEIFKKIKELSNRIRILCGIKKNYKKKSGPKSNKLFLWEKIQKLLSPKKLTGDQKVNELLKSIKKGNKREFQKICRLYGNVFEKWMFELLDTIEKLKSELV